MMNRLLLATLVVVPSSALALASNSPISVTPGMELDCVEPGATIVLEFTRPNLADVDLAGPGAKWTGKYDADGHALAGGSGDPRIMDEDFGLGALNDDEMGAAAIPTDDQGDPLNNKARAPLKANGSKGITGPNGINVTGSDRGECAEVYVSWTFYFQPEWGPLKFNFWIEGSVKSQVVEVCPC